MNKSFGIQPYRTGRKLSVGQIVARRRKVNAGARTRTGKRVRSVERLAELARERKSVYCDNCLGLLPAVVVINMSAGQVYEMIQGRRIYGYKPKGGNK